jgi:hypothetical protein
VDGRICDVLVSSTYDDLPDISPEEPDPALPRCTQWEMRRRSTPMAREHDQVKGVTDKAGGAIKDGANKQPNKQANKQAGPEFDRPLGSSRNDKVDLRDVAREAAKKSK